MALLDFLGYALIACSYLQRLVDDVLAKIDSNILDETGLKKASNLLRLFIVVDNPTTQTHYELVFVFDCLLDLLDLC